MPRGVYDRLPHMKTHADQVRNQNIITYHLLGCSYGEVARILKLTKSTVKGVVRRYHRREMQRIQSTKLIFKAP